MRNIKGFRSKLLAWYRRAKRDLPWRGTADPYRIWISEIMLQQTRVAAVIPYYHRFLEAFPDVEALASSNEEKLLATWAGLGYYSRARNLHRAARMVVGNGGFPGEFKALRELPGIGDYTAAAIASIAFGEPAAVLDGNVMRVLCRLTAEAGDIRAGAVKNRMRELAGALLDPRHPGDFNQALMELGATVCLPRNPLCPVCPCPEFCLARQQGRQHELPVKPDQIPVLREKKVLFVVRRGGRVLLWRRPGDSFRLAGFWELPEPDQLPGATRGAPAGSFRHSIVNHLYDVQVVPAAISRAPRGFQWVADARLQEIPLSAMAAKALRLEISLRKTPA